MAYGMLVSVAEAGCYGAIFAYVYHHNNTVAVSLLDTKVIRSRNRQHAVSLIGHAVAWLLQVRVDKIGPSIVYLANVKPGRVLENFTK
jgi:hypothetical protein